MLGQVVGFASRPVAPRTCFVGPRCFRPSEQKAANLQNRFALPCFSNSRPTAKYTSLQLTAIAGWIVLVPCDPARHLLARLLTPVLSLFPDKDVVRDGIPGVMNADEEQQQRRRANAKQGHAQNGGEPRTPILASVAYAAKGSRA